MNTRTSLRTAGLIILAAMLLVVASCKKQGDAQPLPASNEAAGWAKTGETKTYTPANLSDYIDGGSEQYIKAGFKGAATSDYKFRSKIEAVADVYHMTDAAAAKKVYDADPAGNAQPASVGDAARSSAQSLVFRKGAYLVRIVAYQDSPDVQPALVGLGQAIDRKISQ